MKPAYIKTFFITILIVLLAARLAPVWGLMAGLIFSVLWGSPFQNASLSKLHKPLLQFAVVGLGFGMDVHEVFRIGAEGLRITLITLVATLAWGILLARWLKLDSKIALLISSGTAICGGSAIAALSPVVGAKSKDMSVALGVVFILNALALFFFPVIGRWLHLSEEQFAWWSAIAIHDTSSVVGAAAQFGDTSLALATTIKLTRALWIVPFTLAVAQFYPAHEQKNYFPYFIVWFMIAAILNTLLPGIQPITAFITVLSKSSFTVVLFLIGVGVHKIALREMGLVPMIYGVLLWITIICGSLGLIYFM